jgi:hypothetical protein
MLANLLLIIARFIFLAAGCRAPRKFGQGAKPSATAAGPLLMQISELDAAAR